ncbi:MAG TPA: DUF2807 domain-containing protein [Chitinophagaceae bacterium]|jgi:hypothetical protein
MNYAVSLSTVLFTLLFPVSSSLTTSSQQPVEEKNMQTITSLVINANVTVVLVNAYSQPVRIGGNDLFLLNVVLKQTGRKLVIESNKKRDLRNKGIIYIPAAGLEYIEINSAAAVRSANFLKIPLLEIRVNGECQVDISNLGQLKIKEGPDHEIRYKVKKETISGSIATIKR